MQFTSIIASVLAVSGLAAAQYNGTTPHSTGAAAPSGTGSAPGASGSSPAEFDSGASTVGASALGLAVAGGVALLI
ncbi:hypothetical protein MBLNU230_g6001t1 [Neophaeotheca triangularis]